MYSLYWTTVIRKEYERQIKPLTCHIFLVILVEQLLSAIVEAHFLVLLAGDIHLLVELGSRLVQLHELVEGTNLELGLVNLYFFIVYS
jgi:hypothetical protein